MADSLILLIDTSLGRSLIALSDGTHILSESVQEGYANQSESLFNMIADVFLKAEKKQNALSGIGVLHGPGSYTGLRLSLAAVKGLAMGLHLPVKALSGFDVLAQQALEDPSILQKDFIVTIDSRRGDYFCQKYNALLEQIDEAFIASEEELSAKAEKENLVIFGQTAKPLSSQAILKTFLACPTPIGSVADLKPFYMRPTEFIKPSCKSSS